MISSELVSIFSYGFIQRAILSGVFVSVLCSILGLFLVLKRLSLIGDGLSHVSFGAIALGLFLGITPLYVSIPVVVIGSLLILALSEKSKVYGDSAIGIVSSVGLASGVILSSLSKGFNVDLMNYLFGNILAVSQQETILSVVIGLIIFLLIYFFYYDLVSVSFNEDEAKVSGINVGLINSLLVVLTAITVVLAVRVVGVMLVSAFLVMPAVTSLQVSTGFRAALFVSILVSVLSLILGIVLSFILNFPTGATIVMMNFGFLLISLLFKKSN